jgi:hypothetical protein
MVPEGNGGEQMTDYDGKTFKELLGMLTDQVVNVLTLGVPPPDPDGLQLAIRMAAVNEASVGSVSIKMRELDGYPLLDHLTLLHEEHPYEWNRYILIPRSDPHD